MREGHVSGRLHALGRGKRASRARRVQTRRGVPLLDRRRSRLILAISLALAIPNFDLIRRYTRPNERRIAPVYCHYLGGMVPTQAATS